eukprot:scaffold43615_cov31-Tisochrysis_lutea.AAC.2
MLVDATGPAAVLEISAASAAFPGPPPRPPWPPRAPRAPGPPREGAALAEGEGAGVLPDLPKKIPSRTSKTTAAPREYRRSGRLRFRTPPPKRASSSNDGRL